MRRAVAIVCALALAGCCSVDPLYLEADRATYDAVAPEYRIYVQEDQALDQAQEDRRQRTLAAWEARIKAAEAEQ